jgi:hypothetical protein
MRKRLLLVGGLLLITLAGGAVMFARWATAFTPGVSYENLNRLRYLMTQQQVEDVLGGPPNRSFPIAMPQKAGPPVPAGMSAEWNGRGFELCSLMFDTAGCLQQINYRRLPDAEPEIWNPPWDESLLDRVRSWLGL